MALTGLEIFKLTPKENCKDCGFITCLSFSMEVASGGIEIDKCPHMKKENLTKFLESTAQPLKAQSISVPVENNMNDEIKYSNKIKRIVINDNCVSCGSCSLISDHIEEDSSGKAFPIEPCLISNEEINQFENVISGCPVNAISLINAGMTANDGKKGLEEMKKIIIDTLKNYKIPFPIPSEYEFNKNEYAVPKAYPSGEYNYDYKSSSRAEGAGLKEFDRVMYSQSKAIVQQLLVDCKNKKLRRYSHYDKNTGNYYYDRNKEIEKLLKEIVVQLKFISDNKINIPEGFEVFDVEPVIGKPGDSFDQEINMYQIRHLEEIWFTDQILNKRESLSWFETFIDYDDTQDYKGKYKYCYKNISSVCEKFGNYLLTDMEYCLNKSDGIKRVIESPIKLYCEKAESILLEKTTILINEIDKLLKS